MNWAYLQRRFFLAPQQLHGLGDVGNLRQTLIDDVPEAHVLGSQILLHRFLVYLVVDFQVVFGVTGVRRPIHGHLGIPFVGIAGEKGGRSSVLSEQRVQPGLRCLVETLSAQVRL